jgi:hypothetical protein
VNLGQRHIRTGNRRDHEVIRSLLMSDDKSKAEGQFNREAIIESIERMKPELIACSEAAHKAKDAEVGDDAVVDRAVELGYLVECLSGMCGPHLLLLHEIAHALEEVHPDVEEKEKPAHHRHH